MIICLLLSLLQIPVTIAAPHQKVDVLSEKPCPVPWPGPDVPALEGGDSSFKWAELAAEVYAGLSPEAPQYSSIAATQPLPEAEATVVSSSIEIPIATVSTQATEPSSTPPSAPTTSEASSETLHPLPDAPAAQPQPDTTTVTVAVVPLPEETSSVAAEVPAETPPSTSAVVETPPASTSASVEASLATSVAPITSTVPAVVQETSTSEESKPLVVPAPATVVVDQTSAAAPIVPAAKKPSTSLADYGTPPAYASGPPTYETSSIPVYSPPSYAGPPPVYSTASPVEVTSSSEISKTRKHRTKSEATTVSDATSSHQTETKHKHTKSSRPSHSSKASAKPEPKSTSKSAIAPGPKHSSKQHVNPAPSHSKQHHSSNPGKSSAPNQQLTSSQVEPNPRSTSAPEINSVHPNPTGNPKKQKDSSAGGTQNPAPLTELTLTDTVVVTLLTTLTTSQMQTATESSPAPSWTVITSLERSGEPTKQPFRTMPISSHNRIKPITTGSRVIKSHSVVRPTAPTGKNIFSKVAGSPSPPPQISPRGNHPVPRTGLVGTEPFQTNKFYGNFYLGDRLEATWTHPYSIGWNGGGGVTGSWGIAISQIPRNLTFYGPPNSIGAASYFANPLGLQSLILSAAELGNSTNLTMSSLKALSVNVNLAPATGAANILTFPVVQGMGFLTGQYIGATPTIQSSIFFTTLTFAGNNFGAGSAKYIVGLQDNTTWVLYITPSSGKAPTLTLYQNSQLVGNKAFSGTIQVAKLPTGATRNAYDKSAGVYATTATVSGSVNKAEGSYRLAWTKAGRTSQTLLMWALPHHIQTFDAPTSRNVTTLQLDTTTKGTATAVIADSWTMAFDDLPYDMAFQPWSPTLRSVNSIPAAAAAAMNTSGALELNEDFESQTNTASMYFSGKGLAKFAFIVVAMQELANNTGLASAGLAKLEDAFNVFVNNTQQTPLNYDTSWGGAVTTDGYTNSGADFGNTYYNDHHFHYGYFVYTASVIAYLNPSWLKQGTNRAWVDMLVRDYANPVDDAYFPMSRMFDWYHGHSWAAGLFESGDGKNEESSSEDTLASYALKMWGKVTGDPNMEARGNLMLAIQAVTLQNYFLMESNNANQPAQFVPNKADGILFENKVDHTTYFGTNIEYIEGIHMLPLNPCSTLIRTQTFVREEWNLYFSQGRVNSIAGGWRGILYANYAIINPKAAYAFFADPNFNATYLDGGASQTWYLAWSAGLGGAS